MAIVAIVISLTGLIYTYVWGSGFQYVAQKTEAYDMFAKPMLSKSPPEAKDLPIDRIVEIAQQENARQQLDRLVPAGPQRGVPGHGQQRTRPVVNEMLFIDRASGEILEDRYISQTKTDVLVGDVELSAARRHDLGTADQDPVAGDLRDPDDVAGDRRLDVVGASPDWPAGPAPPRRRPPPALARRHNYGDQHFATDCGPLRGGGAGD